MTGLVVFGAIVIYIKKILDKKNHRREMNIDEIDPALFLKQYIAIACTPAQYYTNLKQT